MAVEFPSFLLLRLLRLRLELCCCCGDGLLACAAVGDFFGADVGEDGFAWDLVLAFAAAGGGEAAVALDEAGGFDASDALEVVDVLGVVGLKTVVVLQETDEGVRGRVEFAVRQDVAGQVVESASGDCQNFVAQRINAINRRRQTHLGSSSKLKMSKTSSGSLNPCSINLA